MFCVPTPREAAAASVQICDVDIRLSPIEGGRKKCRNYKTFFYFHILFPTELHLKNVYYLYSACSNPTDVV